MLERIKQLLIVIGCFLLVCAIGAAFRVKNETPNENKPSTENSASESTGNKPSTENNGSDSTEDSSSDNTDDVMPGDYSYYLGECTVYEDDNIYIKPEKATVKVGDTFRLNVVSKNNSTITYDDSSSQNEGVLDVDDRGNVTALGVGIGYISITIPGHLYLVKITVDEA